MNDPHQFLKKYYGQLVGGVITGFHMIDDDDCIGPDEAWPLFAVRMPNGERVWVQVSRDEEMNGPGFLMIEEDD